MMGAETSKPLTQWLYWKFGGGATTIRQRGGMAIFWGTTFVIKHAPLAGTERQLGKLRAKALAAYLGTINLKIGKTMVHRSRV